MKKYLLFSFFILNFSCQEKFTFDSYQSNKERLKSIQIDDLSYQKEVNYDSILYNLKKFTLESNEDLFIGSVDKVILSDGILYIMDKNISHSIFSYDISGKFIFKISDLGEGPEQYRELRDFTVSESSSFLSVLDFAGRNILRYDKMSGEFLGKERLSNNVYYGAIETSSNQFSIGHIQNCDLFGNCKNLTLLNNNYEVDTSFFNIPKNLRNFALKPNQVFSRNKNNVYYTELLNDTIYQIDFSNKQMMAIFSVDFQEYSMPDNFKYSSNNSDADNLIKYYLEENKTLGFNKYYVGDSLLYFNFGKPNLRYVFYNYYSEKGVSFDRHLTNNPYLAGEIVGVYNDKFISVISNEILLKLKMNFYTPDSLIVREKYLEFYNHVKNIDQGSGPMIVFFSVKI